MRDGAAYLDQLKKLMPPGLAWRGAVTEQLLDGLSAELARVDSRAARLIDEADPLTALELLPDWERVAGLPDTCVAVPDVASARQIAVARKMSGLGGQSIAFFVELAERLGVEVKIEEFAPAICGASFSGDPCSSDAWRFTWLVRLLDDTESEGSLSRLRFAWAMAGAAGAGDPIRSFGIESLECLIRRAAPAHTHVLFAYPDEAEPVLWFDFIGQTGV